MKIMDEKEDLPIPLRPVKPLVTPEQAAEEWARFEALKAKLLTEDDYQTIAGKKYIKRSGFRKIAVYFGLSDRIIDQERIEREDESFLWRIVVEVEAPNGRISIGVGACDSRERNFAHLEHDVYAIAHTRAKSRAISDMVAGGAVSAEEMQAGPEEYPEEVESTPQPAGANSIVEIENVLQDHLPGVDEILSITETDDAFKIKAAKYLEVETWQKVNSDVQSFGGRWISSGKDSHWIIPRKKL
jgi:hypothetical protein